MATKLYIGGVSYGSTEDSLRDAFAQAGNVVSAKIIIDKMTGRSRGFAFVEMGSEEEAQKAIALWNGKELDGRALTVNEARPMEERAPRTGGTGGYHGGNRDSQGGDQGGSRW
jgi:RNA recognition motif-containing protein